MNTNSIEIRGLTKSFRKFKLGPLNLTVPRGSIYGFIGPNGAGKTTTIDLILGMGKPDGGKITLLGRDHEEEAVAAKTQIGYASPDLNFSAWRKIGNAIQFVSGFYPDWDDEDCARLLEVFELSTSDSIGSLSFGSKTKLSLLLALAHRPALLILDEPTVGLDAISKQAAFSQLLALVEDGARTVFISTHALSDIERFADHIGMIKNGQLLIEGSTDQIVERYRMVDFKQAGDHGFQNTPGIHLVSKEAGRCRALVDQSQWSGALGKDLGFDELSNSPVTLEELFVSFAKN
jgi:ABC-2 type transport system ATP-binding protein